MIGTLGWRARKPWAMRTIGSSDQPNSCSSGSTPAQRIEQLHGIGAGIDLVGEMIDDRLDQQIDQQSEGIGMAIGPALHLGEVPAAAALDHVAGERERRAGEAQQCGLLGGSALRVAEIAA